MKGSAGESGALFIEIPEHIDLTGLPAFEPVSYTHLTLPTILRV